MPCQWRFSIDDIFMWSWLETLREILRETLEKPGEKSENFQAVFDRISRGQTLFAFQGCCWVSQVPGGAALKTLEGGAPNLEEPANCRPARLSLASGAEGTSGFPSPTSTPPRSHPQLCTEHRACRTSDPPSRSSRHQTRTNFERSPPRRCRAFIHTRARGLDNGVPARPCVVRQQLRLADPLPQQ